MFFCELHNLLLLSLSLIWAPFSLRDKDNFDLLKDLSKDKWKKILFTLFTLISCFSFFTGSKWSIRKIFNLIKNKKSQHPSLNGKEFIKRSGIRVTPDLSFKLKINNLYKKNTPLLIQEFVKATVSNPNLPFWLWNVIHYLLDFLWNFRLMTYELTLP